MPGITPHYHFQYFGLLVSKTLILTIFKHEKAIVVVLGYFHSNFPLGEHRNRPAPTTYKISHICQ